MRRLLAALLTAAALGRAAAARADEPVVKKMDFAERGRYLVVTTSFTELFDRKAYERLDNGMETTVALRAFIYRKGDPVPVSFTMATYRVAYDLWDNVYSVRVVDPRGIADRKLDRRADALRAITEMVDFPLAGLDRIAIGPHYYLDLAIELNPVSQQQLAEMRRWLTRPAGSANFDSDSSFFGSVVSIFANPKLQGADRVLRLRSQPFYRVKR